MKSAKSEIQSTEFVDKLYKMLEEPQNHSYIQWCSSGNSFLIINPTEFGKCILNKHFKHGNLSSFVRQLNKYDFHKIKSSEGILKQFGGQVWEFKHIHFQKNRMELLKNITRKKSNADKRFKSSREMSTDTMEASNRIQSQIIGTLKMLTVHFQVLVEEVNDLKKKLKKKETLFKESVNVLVAEDNVTCSSYAGAILKKIGCTVDLVEREDEVLQRITETKYDAIFLSSKIIGIHQIISNFRQYDSITPIIISVSGIVQDEYLGLLTLGVNEVLSKPYHQDSLVQLMLKHCYTPRHESIHKQTKMNVW
ncbi:hypothetical protein NEOKW01_1998 [Nematocida sp. AWRm80]|nr:hypothetical protein NEOKW01_1998 [Nematocida sp. AWRm80]